VSERSAHGGAAATPLTTANRANANYRGLDAVSVLWLDVGTSGTRGSALYEDAVGTYHC
jgi:hypothetical protein